jgi:hypothetical protein
MLQVPWGKFLGVKLAGRLRMLILGRLSQPSQPMMASHRLLWTLSSAQEVPWGKPYWAVVHVNIGQIIASIRSKDGNASVIMEAPLCSCCNFSCCNFSGSQKIVVSKKWVLSMDEYLKGIRCHVTYSFWGV